MTKDKALQITNDISEDMCRATRGELIETVRWWSNEYARLALDMQNAELGKALKALQEELRAQRRTAI